MPVGKIFLIAELVASSMQGPSWWWHLQTGHQVFSFWQDILLKSLSHDSSDQVIRSETLTTALLF